MKKLLQFIVDYAYVIMLCGMIVGITGLLLLIRAKSIDGSREAGLIIGIVGIVIYILGRIAHAYKRKYSQKKTTTDEE